MGYIVKSGVTPNAVSVNVKAGFSHKRIYVDGFVDRQVTKGGGNLGETDFYKTGISHCKIGLNIYAPIVKGLGVSAGGSTTLSGKNCGKANRISAGVVYSFGKKKS